MMKKRLNLATVQNRMQRHNKAKMAFDLLEKEMEVIAHKEARIYFGGFNGYITTGDLSSGGLSFIQSAEGYSSTLYQDSAGYWTIGYGHKLTSSEIANGTYLNGITQEQAGALLSQDTTAAQNAVRSLVTVNLTQSQFDALVSFVYNIGPTNFQTSTLLQKINAGDMASAADEFSKWVYAGGQPSTGLSNRRAQEEELFSGGDYNYWN